MCNDGLGRPAEVIQNSLGSPANSVLKTFYGFDGMNDTTSITVVNNLPGGGFHDQTTHNIYGVTTAGGSSINSNDLLGEVQYPGFGTAGNVATDEKSTYNAQGDRIGWIDRDGNSHVFAFDALARETDETVTPASGIDGSITHLGFGFDSAGNANLFTSYNAGGTPVNQVQRTYNGFHQVTAELQNNTGAITTPGTLAVGYGYTSAPTGSLESTVMYPDGRTETYGRDPTTQVSSVTDSPSIANPSGQVLETYQYLGLGTILHRTRPLSSTTGGAGTTTTQITGATALDAFGRVGDAAWNFSTTSTGNGGTSTTSSNLDEHQYGYNLDGAVTSSSNLLNAAFSETYGLDGLNRMNSFSRGGTVLASWDLDSQGNKYNGPYGGSYNDWNKIIATSADNALDAETSVTLTPSWDTNNLQTATVTYNSWDQVVGTLATNSNTISNPRYRDDYDALGRLIDVTLLNSDGTVASSTRRVYAGNNVIEERDGSGNVTAQYVWAPDGVLILRDRNTGAGAAADSRIPQRTNGNGTGTALNERMYALSDAAGSVTALADIAGNVQERYVYNQDGSPTILDANWNPTPPRLKAAASGARTTGSTCSMACVGSRWITSPPPAPAP